MFHDNVQRQRKKTQKDSQAKTQKYSREKTQKDIVAIQAFV